MNRSWNTSCHQHGFVCVSDRLLDLLLSLVERNPECCKGNLVGLLFGSYQATLHTAGNEWPGHSETRIDQFLAEVCCGSFFCLFVLQIKNCWDCCNCTRSTTASWPPSSKSWEQIYNECLTSQQKSTCCRHFGPSPHRNVGVVHVSFQALLVGTESSGAPLHQAESRRLTEQSALYWAGAEQPGRAAVVSVRAALPRHAADEDTGGGAAGSAALWCGWIRSALLASRLQSHHSTRWEITSSAQFSTCKFRPHCSQLTERKTCVSNFAVIVVDVIVDRTLPPRREVGALVVVCGRLGVGT